MSHSTFLSAYTAELHHSVADNPDVYKLALSSYSVEELAERMVAAASTGRANIITPTFERTCQRLGIKHNYPAILAYIASEAGGVAAIEQVNSSMQPSTV